MDSNKVSERRSQDVKPCEQTVKEADCSAFSYGINAENCLKQLLNIENEAKRLNFESVTIAHDLDVEKDLRHAKKKYYNELCEFMSKTQGFAQNVKQKCEIKKEIYGSIDKIINGLKSQVEVCKDIVPLTQTIYDTLVTRNKNEKKHYRDCVIMFAEFVNGAVQVNGLGESQGVIGKVEIGNHRSANDIAKDCLQTMKLLKERESMDPFSEKIAANLRIEHETDLLIQQINAKNAESKVEEERLEVEINNREQNIKHLEMEIEKMKQEASAIEEGEKAKLVKLIYSNMEKTTSFITMGKKIDEMKTNLGELPFIEKTYHELKEKLETSEEKLVLLENEIENVRFSCKTKQAHIDELKKRSDKMEKEQSAQIQEIRNNNGELEVQLRDLQVKLQEESERLERNKKTNVETLQRLETIEKEYKAAKDSVRQKKAEHKKNMREKRKIKENLDKEFFMLSFKMNLPC
ncbi:spindle assembly checkpoint component MAD1-like [Tetranychus urticae]|uniref:spindle assembly checkpoint component MAD1-like n=1 Tax=Tetranychus urticae TaxID=32264 RepID=UPI00077BA4F4|nr:spindle assembly checkpoint component MAD1-like [Tetranychus urticae]